MKIPYRILGILLTLLAFACGNKGGHEHAAHDIANSDNPNQALYNQVMDIHDEVMPATEDLYNISKRLKAQLKEESNETAKTELQKRINYVDSVNAMMMVWMRKFKPQPDTANAERVREYYETELEKIKQVKEAMLTALEKEKSRD